MGRAGRCGLTTKEVQRLVGEKRVPQAAMSVAGLITTVRALAA